MTRLDEIKNEVAVKAGYSSWPTMFEELRRRRMIMVLIGRLEASWEQYTRECCKASLEKACDNGALSVYRESITNPENIVLL